MELLGLLFLILVIYCIVEFVKAIGQIMVGLLIGIVVCMVLYGLVKSIMDLRNSKPQPKPKPEARRTPEPKKLTLQQKKELYGKAKELMAAGTTDAYRQAAQMFEQLGSWEDAAIQKYRCEMRLDAAEVRRRAKGRRVGLGLLAAVLAVTGSLLWSFWIVPNRKMEQARLQIAQGEYDSAIEVLTKLKGSFGMGDSLLKQAWYEKGNSLHEKGMCRDAVHCFSEAQGYENAVQRVMYCALDYVDGLLEEGRFDDAAQLINLVEEADPECEGLDWQKRHFAYVLGRRALENEDWDEAIRLLGLAKEYPGAAQALETALQEKTIHIYQTAQSLLEKGDREQAALLFGRVAGYEDAARRSLELWQTFADRSSVAVGDDFTAVLWDDGTVSVASNRNQQPEVDSWTDIISIAAGSDFTVGLKKDGTVVVTDKAGTSAAATVRGWENVTAIYVYDYNIIALKVDGTILCTGGSADHVEQLDASKGFKSLSIGSGHLIGIGFDGSVQVEEWKWFHSCNLEKVTRAKKCVADGTEEAYITEAGEAVAYISAGTFRYPNAVDVAVGDYSVAVVLADGTVTVKCSGEDRYGLSKAQKWKNVIHIEMNDKNIIGVTSNGTVLICGDNTYGQCRLNGWWTAMLRE